jgi:hypothetical protein
MSRMAGADETESRLGLGCLSARAEDEDAKQRGFEKECRDVQK